MKTFTDAQRLNWGYCGRTQRRSTEKKVKDRRIASGLEKCWIEIGRSQEPVRGIFCLIQFMQTHSSNIPTFNDIQFSFLTALQSVGGED